VRDAIQGVLIALASGYVFVLLFLALNIRRPNAPIPDLGFLFVMPLPVLLNYSWFILPIGVVSGMLLPRLVQHRGRVETWVIAGIASAAIATLWAVGSTAVQTTGMESGIERSQIRDFAIGIAPWLALYTLPWVLVFALKRRARSAL